MRHLHTVFHPDVKAIEGNVLERQAVRAIILHQDEILLLYTKRYNDYSFPGGGLHAEETAVQGLQRELMEETGARNIQIGAYFGYVDEYRPHRKADFDLLFMRSHFYLCRTDYALGGTKMEDYEQANGMRPVWIKLSAAIAHNEQVIFESQASMGLSIQRETLMLNQIANEILIAAESCLIEATTHH